jgi:hypothetical protein
MPFYNHISNWNGLEIKVSPKNRWRKRFPFWPYFVGQQVELELHVRRKTPGIKDDGKFHLVEKMADEDKPRMVSLISLTGQVANQEKVFILQDSNRITGIGEIKIWLSNRGYNVDHEPIFVAEAISLDPLILPALLMLVGPLLGLIVGLLLGLLFGG